MFGNLGLAFLAGVLSTLSPCVLPLLPIVLGTAASKHRFGPAALAAGLALSFTSIGIFVAGVGFAIGIGTGYFTSLAAGLLIIVGTVLIVPALQLRVAAFASPVSNWAENRFGRGSGQGFWGQFAIGLLLGAVWSPCVGPTLGAATLLAAQGKDLFQVSITMLAFGIGAALPLLILGTLSREVLLSFRGRITSTGQGLRTVLGLVLIGTGVLVISGADKSLETVLVDASPSWLTQFTTRF